MILMISKQSYVNYVYYIIKGAMSRMVYLIVNVRLDFSNFFCNPSQT